jgi:hypothetical protein
MTAIGTFYRLSGIRFVSSQLTVPAFGIPAINPFSQSTSNPCAIDKIPGYQWANLCRRITRMIKQRREVARAVQLYQDTALCRRI